MEGRVQYPSTLLAPPGTAEVLARNLRSAREEGFAIGMYFQAFIHGGNPRDPHHIGRLHPEWLSYRSDGASMKDNLLSGGADKPYLDGYFLDPGIPRVTEYLTGILTEAIESYSPDWIVLDQVRYPFPEPAVEGTEAGEQPYGYHPVPRVAFQQAKGEDPLAVKKNANASPSPQADDSIRSAWNLERKAFVDRFVQTVHELLIGSYPHTQLATVGYPDPFFASRTLFQDWTGWIDRGWIGGVVLPHHRGSLTDTSDLDRLAPSLREKIWLAGNLSMEESPAEFFAAHAERARGWISFENRPNGFEEPSLPAPVSETLVRVLDEPVVIAQSEGIQSDEVWEEPTRPSHRQESTPPRFTRFTVSTPTRPRSPE